MKSIAIQPSKLYKQREKKKCSHNGINCNHTHQSYPNTKCYHNEIDCNPKIKALQTLGEEKRQRQSLDLGEYTYRVSQKIVKLDEIILWIIQYTILSAEVGDLWTHWPHLAHLSTEGIGEFEQKFNPLSFNKFLF